MDAFDREEHPHRRRNPLTGEWVLVSPHRARRPWQGQVERVAEEELPAHDPACYLCPGNARAGGQVNPAYAGTYSFVNDFSALREDTPGGGSADELFTVEGVRGVCKVIIFSPDHSLTLARMGAPAIAEVIRLWQAEYRELSSRPGIRYVQIFENKGAMMGCSNPHPHGQIWASESVPGIVAREAGYQARYLERHGRPLLLDYGARELEAGERVLFRNDHFLVVVPFWAVWPFEAMILPRAQAADVLAFGPEQVGALAEAIQVLTAKYDNLFRCSFPYSAGMHQAPCGGGEYPGYTWHMSFLPPLLRSATVRKFMVGYELLAEPQRDLTPEQAAARLREQPSVHYRAA